MRRRWVYRWCCYAWGIISVLHAPISYSQSVTLSGAIVEALTLQPISNVIVVLQETGQRTHTNEIGRFTYRDLTSGSYTISVHHIAYLETERRVVASQGIRDSIVIQLQPSVLRSEEVIVRSTRSSSFASESPFPTEVLTSARLSEHPAVTISDALAKLPGISLVRDGPWETTVSIRGLSRSNIVTLIDNTRIETASDISGALSLINLHDLERVEVNKSAGSVLYGTGALGGVLHLVSKRPSFTDDFQSEAEWTSGISSVDGCLSQYLALDGSTDRYAIRLSGGFRNAGNTSTPIGTLENSMYSDFSFNGSMNVRTLGDQSLLISYQRSQAQNTGIPGGSPIASSASARYTLARRELFGFEYSIPNISPRIDFVSVRISRQEIDRNVEIIQSPTLTLTPHAIHAAASIQIETRIRPVDGNAFVAGLEAWQRSLDSRRERIDKNLNQLVGERPAPDSRFSSAGVYAQDEWTLLPQRLVATIGARYDWIRIRNDESLNPEYVLISGILQTPSANQKVLWNAGSASDESWSAEGGLRYALHHNVDVTFLAATAFRSPSLEERFQYIDLGNLVRVGNPNLQPERSIGLNSGLNIHYGSMRIQTDIFLNNLNNLVADVPGVYEGRPAFVKANIGESRLYGYEVSFDRLMSRWLALKTSLAYVRGEDLHNRKNLPQIAPLEGEIGLTGYFAPYGTLSLSATFAGTQNSLAEGEVRTPGYAVYNVVYSGMPWNIGQLSFTTLAGIENCFNKAYQNHLSTLRGIIKFEPGRNFFFAVTVSM